MFRKQALIITFFQALAVAASVDDDDLACEVDTTAVAPAVFTANNNIGPGGTTFVDSPHFRFYGLTAANGNNSLNMLEASYDCFVDTLGWRSSGLAFNDATDDDGPWTKVNLYSVSTLEGAAGVMHSDYRTGMSWLEVVSSYVAVPSVTIHEYGHGLTYHAKTWVDQGRTGAWWETVAEWFADTYKTSPLCAASRSKFGQSTGATDINLNKVIGDSFQVIVDGTAGSGNYYQAWPFLAYLTYNPDNFAGFGTNTIRESFARYSKGSNETPLHTFARLSANATIQEVVGRYWARMAFVDIGHPSAQAVFLRNRARLNYANLDAQTTGTYKVKAARQPRYMGANIIPLKKTGQVNITTKIATEGPFTATLSVRNTSTGVSRYINFVAGNVSATVSAEEEATVVIANTPGLILYDGFALSSSEANKGLDYTLTLTGATA